MNTDVAIHPKLHHYGLTTAKLDAMIEWYRTVLGMTVNHRSTTSAAVRNGAPFSAVAFLSNDEADHRLVLFETHGAPTGAAQRTPGPLQHIAFQCDTFDDLLGTYVRLKRAGIMPRWAADHGLGTAIYYEDPDRNIVEVNVNNYGDPWTATEHIKTMPPAMVQVDPDKMVAARQGGASAWELHQRAGKGDFVPAELFDRRERS